MKLKVESIKLPNFLIAGTAKSGTSTIARYLDLHPDVCFSRVQEPNFFAFDKQYAKGLDYYTTLFSHHKGEPMLGEKSWRYSCTNFYPQVLDRIQKHLPQLKIIYVVRDPLARGISMFRELRDSGQDIIPADCAIALTTEGLILDSMRYKTHFSRYQSIYGINNTLLIFYEDFANNPDNTYEAITNFLGIERYSPGFNIHENNSIDQHSDTWLLELLRRWKLDSPARKIAPESWRKATRLILKRPLRNIVISPTARKKYLDLVRDECLAILEVGVKSDDFWRLY